jgi:hypothetical protein
LRAASIIVIFFVAKWNAHGKNMTIPPRKAATNARLLGGKAHEKFVIIFIARQIDCGKISQIDQ